MSTFLQLVNRARQFCGVSGADLVTVVGQTGEARRFVNWMIQSWKEVQLSQTQWKFLHLDFTVSTVAGTRSYAKAATTIAGTPFRDWDYESLRMYADTVNFSDETFVPFVDDKSFRDVYEFGNMRVTRSRPYAYTVGDAMDLRLGPLPDAVYTVAGQYWRGAQILAADTDELICPVDYEDIVVYATKMKYGLYEAASEAFEDGKDGYNRLYHDLMINQLPMIGFGPPLA